MSSIKHAPAHRKRLRDTQTRGALACPCASPPPTCIYAPHISTTMVRAALLPLSPIRRSRRPASRRSRRTQQQHILGPSAPPGKLRGLFPHPQPRIVKAGQPSMVSQCERREFGAGAYGRLLFACTGFLHFALDTYRIQFEDESNVYAAFPE
ncbi:hypothetical protein C8R44DRAFT_987736, partial [Mycena epipterygia]